MRTDELIVQLARGAGPVQRLPKPSVRLARWAAAAVPLAALGILVVGPRVDVLTAIRQPAYAGLALLTLLTALLAAASAFVLSVPGAERSPLQRALPLVFALAWAIALAGLLIAGGNALARILSPPVHLACIIEIAAFALLPGRVLFTMLKRAAPLQPTWSAAFAVLAATALGAAATQIVCPLDDPAHYLAGHWVPLVLIATVGTLAARGSLDWLRRGTALTR